MRLSGVAECMVRMAGVVGGMGSGGRAEGGVWSGLGGSGWDSLIQLVAGIKVPQH